MLILDALFPRRCLLCRVYLPAGSGPLCPACARALPGYRDGTALRLSGIDGAAAALHYRGAVRAAMQRYKFHHARRYAAFFAEEMLPVLRVRLEGWRPDLVTFVPLGFGRWHGRGYNQSALLAKRLARICGLPCRATLIKRPWAGHQVGRDARQRRQAAKEAFLLRPGTALCGRRVVLIDDVLTTGATAGVCGRLLRQAGAERIFALTAARTPFAP